MPVVFIICLFCMFCERAQAQPELFEATTPTAAGDTALFLVQIPSSYDSQRPPAIIVGWHALGGSESEIFAHPYSDLCEERGWILASHMGPNDRHWNTRLPQLHCRAMLDYLMERFPFSPDSIYMCGGSMGGAAGQVWHNNNCAYDDYLIAATAGGSQILDCQLRQEQYLASGDTNRSMRAAFGGFPFESDSVAYEYHRYSAVHFADTSESMHFNSLTVPVLSSWGAEQFEWDAYGYAAQDYAVLRRFGAESFFGAASWQGHGFNILDAGLVCDWFSGYSANRFPDTLALAADEDGRYYYCDVVLGDSAYTFARWDIRKEAGSKRIDIALLQNVAALTVNFVFPWPELDTLRCHWQSIDPTGRTTNLTLRGLPARAVVSLDGVRAYRVSGDGELTLHVSGDEEFELTFDERLAAEPFDLRLVSVYPNPVNSEFRLRVESFDRQLTTLDLYDIQGRIAKTTEVQLVPGLNELTVPVTGLASGVYFVRTGDSAAIKVLLIR